MSLEELVDEIQREHRANMTTRGRRRAKRETKGTRHFIFFCEYDACGQEFHRSKRGYKYCSKGCHNKAQTTEKGRIVRYARAGTTAGYAAYRLGMARSTFRRLLRQYDLYRTWQLARFKKCQKAGSASAITASETATGTSAR